MLQNIFWHLTLVNSDKGVGEGIEDNWNAGREHLQHLGKILKWMQAGVGDNSGFPLPPISLLTHIPTHLLSSALLYRLLKLLWAVNLPICGSPILHRGWIGTVLCVVLFGIPVQRSTWACDFSLVFHNEQLWNGVFKKGLVWVKIILHLTQCHNITNATQGNKHNKCHMMEHAFVPRPTVCQCFLCRLKKWLCWSEGWS